jgi:hypothetical protein
LNVEQPRASIEVRDAAGSSAAQEAEKLVADAEVAVPGFQPKRRTVTTGGEPAVVLDGMPGQDINRQVVMVHDGRLYHLTFAPLDDTNAERSARLEELYTTVMGSFAFLPAPGPTVTPTAQGGSAGDVALIWEGTADVGSGGEVGCDSLILTPDRQSLIKPCGSPQSTVQLLPNQAREWTELLAHFAPFEVRTGQEYLAFRGTGQVAGAAWQRAIAAWARFTFMELRAGRVGASLKTVMSWWLDPVPDQPGSCGHLLVLVFGYAYHSTGPCDGSGPDTNLITGWVGTEDWTTFDGWLYGRAPVYQGNNYFAGQGSQEMGQEELAELSGWARRVYGALAPPATSTPASTAGMTWKTFKADGGYQISYPLELYSLRDAPSAPAVLFPGVKVVDPNDSFYYREPRSVVYKVSIAVGENTQQLSLDAPAQLLAYNMVIPYDPQLLSGHAIREVTLGGAKAVRVDDLPAGAAGITVQIATVRDGRVYEVLVEPKQVSGNQAESFEPGAVTPANRQLVEDIVATFQFGD